jgi:hypothetical protein
VATPKSQPRQIVDLALILDATLAAVDANGGPYGKWRSADHYRGSLAESASIPFARDYEHHTFFTHKTIPQGTKALITRPRRGLLGKITHADVRLAKDGERVRSVPIDYSTF